MVAIRIEVSLLFLKIEEMIMQHPNMQLLEDKQCREGGIVMPPMD